MGQYEQVSIWWMLPFAGILTFLLGQAIPYYRFMNATAAPMALAGLFSWFGGCSAATAAGGSPACSARSS